MRSDEAGGRRSLSGTALLARVTTASPSLSLTSSARGHPAGATAYVPAEVLGPLQQPAQADLGAPSGSLLAHGGRALRGRDRRTRARTSSMRSTRSAAVVQRPPTAGEGAHPRRHRLQRAVTGQLVPGYRTGPAGSAGTTSRSSRAARAPERLPRPGRQPPPRRRSVARAPRSHRWP